MRESELPDPMTILDAVSLRHESGSRVRVFLRRQGLMILQGDAGSVRLDAIIPAILYGGTPDAVAGFSTAELTLAGPRRTVVRRDLATGRAVVHVNGAPMEIPAGLTPGEHLLGTDLDGFLEAFLDGGTATDSPTTAEALTERLREAVSEGLGLEMPAEDPETAAQITNQRRALEAELRALEAALPSAPAAVPTPPPILELIDLVDEQRQIEGHRLDRRIALSEAVETYRDRKSSPLPVQKILDDVEHLAGRIEALTSQHRSIKNRAARKLSGYTAKTLIGVFLACGAALAGAGFWLGEPVLLQLGAAVGIGAVGLFGVTWVIRFRALLASAASARAVQDELAEVKDDARTAALRLGATLDEKRITPETLRSLVDRVAINGAEKQIDELIAPFVADKGNTRALETLRDAMSVPMSDIPAKVSPQASPLERLARCALDLETTWNDALASATENARDAARHEVETELLRESLDRLRQHEETLASGSVDKAEIEAAWSHYAELLERRIVPRLQSLGLIGFDADLTPRFAGSPEPGCHELVAIMARILCPVGRPEPGHLASRILVDPGVGLPTGLETLLLEAIDAEVDGEQVIVVNTTPHGATSFDVKPITTGTRPVAGPAQPSPVASGI